MKTISSQIPKIASYTYFFLKLNDNSKIALVHISLYTSQNLDFKETRILPLRRVCKLRSLN